MNIVGHICLLFAAAVLFGGCSSTQPKNSSKPSKNLERALTALERASSAEVQEEAVSAFLQVIDAEPYSGSTAFMCLMFDSDGALLDGLHDLEVRQKVAQVFLFSVSGSGSGFRPLLLDIHSSKVVDKLVLYR